MHPSRTGLERIYFAWFDHSKRIPEEKSILPLLLYLNREMILQTAEAIFTGTAKHFWEQVGEFPFEPWRQSVKKRVAVSSTQGLCFYLGALARLTDQPGDAARIHVVPGTIEIKSGRRYQCVRDVDPGQISRGYGTETYTVLETLESNIDTSTPGLSVDLILQETVKELLVSFRFTSSKGDFSRIGPCKMVEAMIGSTGLVHCPRTGCQKLHAPYESIYTIDGEGNLPLETAPVGQPLVIRRLCGNGLARCLCCVTTWGPRIFRADECLSCSIKAAWKLTGHPAQGPVSII